MARILAIDDEAPFRVVLEKMLRALGHEVVLAADGQEGMKLAMQGSLDLVITDLYMPNQDGLETIIGLRKIAPRLGIIAISGKPAGGPLLRVAQHLGAVSILYKPFSVEELAVALSQATQPASPGTATPGSTSR